MKRQILLASLTAATGLTMLGALLAAPGPKAAKPAADNAAAEKVKVEKYLAWLAESDAPRAAAAQAKWAKIKDQPFDTDSDFIIESLAERHTLFADALDFVDSGAYSNAERKLNELLVGVRDPYLEAHAKYYLGRIKFSTGDWPGAAKDLGELLAKDAGRMTIEHEAAFYHARALANIAPKEQRLEVAKKFADFLEKYPYSKQRYLAAASDLAKEVAKTLPVIRSDSLTKVDGGPEELPNFGKDLRNIEKRISVPVRDTGKTTQKLQADALAYLDNLIDKVEEMKNQSNQSDQKKKKDQDDEKDKKDSKDQKDQKDQKSDMENMPMPQDDPQQKKSTQPKKDSALPKGGVRGTPSLKDLELLRRGNFGNLPPEEVRRIIQEALNSGQIPEKYKRLLELYDAEQIERQNRKK